MKRPAHLTLVDADKYSALVSRCTEWRERAEKAEAYIEVLKKVANEQAENAGLWFRARTAPEEYLQNALRRLHALIEGDALMAALRGEEET